MGVEEPVKFMVVLEGCIAVLPIGRMAGPVVLELMADIDIFEGEDAEPPMGADDLEGEVVVDEDEEEPRLSRFTRPPQMSSFLAGVAG